MFRHTCLILLSAITMLWSCLTIATEGTIKVYFNGTVLYIITADDNTLILTRDENGLGSIFSLPFEEMKISPTNIAKENGHLIELTADGKGVILRNKSASWNLPEFASAVKDFTNDSENESPAFHTSNPLLLLCHPNSVENVFALLKQEPISTSLYSLADIRAWRIFKPALNLSVSACPTYCIARIPSELTEGDTMKFDDYTFRTEKSGTEVKVEIVCAKDEATEVDDFSDIECVLVNSPLPRNFLQDGQGEPTYLSTSPMESLKSLPTHVRNLPTFAKELVPEELSQLCVKVYEQPLSSHKVLMQAAQEQWSRVPVTKEVFSKWSESLPTSKEALWQFTTNNRIIDALKAGGQRVPVLNRYLQ